MLLQQIGPRGYLNALAAATLAYQPPFDRAGIVRTVLISNMSGADTWTITVAGRELMRFRMLTTDNQRLLLPAAAAGAQKPNFFDYCRRALGIDPSIPVPLGMTLTVASVGGATADIQIEFEGGLSDVQPFYALLAATAERKGFRERDISYFTQLMEAFGEQATITLARYNGEVVYGALVVTCGATAYYLYGASGGDRSVKPSELGQYRAMLWAKQRGATRYDMWGIPAHPTKQNPLYGVYTFKSGFSGIEERYVGALDLPLTPVVGARLPAMETFALKSLSLARGHGFQIEDHLA
ncbi:MAG: peptidoglycan bridge formation glycyltransferase FemA/FemB family protein [Ktedonobacterales bacterium]